MPRERKPVWVFAEAQVGDMLKIGLEEIREDACRWPLGDPTSEEFVYCGVQTAKGRSYCAGHCRMAYKPPGSRVWNGERYVALEFDGRCVKRQPAVSLRETGERAFAGEYLAGYLPRPPSQKTEPTF